MGKYTWLIVLGIIAWQVIAGAVQQAAKKQEQKRMAEATRQRSRQPQGGSPAGAASSTGGGDLATRRKAQLDELRRRRAARTGSVDVKVPTAPPSRRPAVLRTPPVAGRPPTPPAAKGIETVEVGYDALRASEAADQRRRAQKLTQILAAEEAQDRREAAEDRSKASEAVRRRRAADRPTPRPADRGAARGAEAEPDAYAQVRTRGSHERLRRLLGQRSTLRDLFVMREIIDLPIALRTTGELD